MLSSVRNQIVFQNAELDDSFSDNEEASDSDDEYSNNNKRESEESYGEEVTQKNNATFEAGENTVSSRSTRSSARKESGGIPDTARSVRKRIRRNSPTNPQISANGCISHTYVSRRNTRSNKLEAAVLPGSPASVTKRSSGNSRKKSVQNIKEINGHLEKSSTSSQNNRRISSRRSVKREESEISPTESFSSSTDPTPVRSSLRKRALTNSPGRRTSARAKEERNYAEADSEAESDEETVHKAVKKKGRKSVQTPRPTRGRSSLRGTSSPSSNMNHIKAVSESDSDASPSNHGTKKHIKRGTDEVVSGLSARRSSRPRKQTPNYNETSFNSFDEEPKEKSRSGNKRRRQSNSNLGKFISAFIYFSSNCFPI